MTAVRTTIDPLKTEALVGPVVGLAQVEAAQAAEKEARFPVVPVEAAAVLVMAAAHVTLWAEAAAATAAEA